MLLLQLLPMIGMVKRQVLTGKQLQATILMTDTVLKLAHTRKLPLAIINMTSTVKKTGSYKKTSSGYNSYDKYGQKLVVTKQILMGLLQNTINTVKK